MINGNGNGNGNDFVHNLRILTAFEMYENCKLYCDHPLFSKVYNENSGVFSSLRNIFDVCLTEESSKQGESDKDKVKHEAVYCCQDKIYCEFITILALSSVVGLKIVTWYPDVFEAKYKLIFSRCIERIGMYLDNCSLEINLLWCAFGSNKPNHFVLLLASYKQGKGNGKQKKSAKISETPMRRQTLKSFSDFFEKKKMVMATVCNEDQVELSSPTNATQQKPHSSIVNAKLMNKPTQCYDVGTFRTQLCV